MQKTIKLQKENVDYTLRLNKRAKGLRLSVALGGMLTVTAPPTLGQNSIEQFILRKSRWVLDKLDYFRQFPKRVVISNKKRHFAEHKGRALTLVQERLEHFHRFYHLEWNKISIRNQKSRWGSCSRKGNLNFNYKIVLLPQHLADYIIVHELCHLGVFNHSITFWDLVAKTLPDHRALRRELRKTPLR